MKRRELYQLIDSFAIDIQFEYHGVNGLIMPLHRDNNITLLYGEDEAVLKTPDEVMAYPMFGGKSLKDICELAVFY